MAEDWARPVVHWDIQARDQAKIRDFYAAMFNWAIGDSPLMPVPPGIGGPEELSGHIFASDKPGITLYIQVRDLRESLRRAAELGGAVLSEPIDVPGRPTIARIADPEDNRLVLVQQ